MFKNYTAAPVAKKDVFPTRLRIKALKIDLPVISQKITQNSWETTEQGVSYLTSSALPGERGNAIFYGHNFANLLGNLVRAKPRFAVEIEFSDKTMRRFVIESTMEVSPDQTNVLATSKESLLTIYTCSGFFDEKRFVVVAKPIGNF